MSGPERHTHYLIDRLRAMGLQAQIADDGGAGYGRLPLAATPFQTLGDAFTLQSATFYTLGHARLKFCVPRALFDLPAIDVSRCRSAADLEQALRRAWASRLRELRAAHAWLRPFGADCAAIAHGTRLTLRLTGFDGPPALVQSRSEILLPSGGPLRAAPASSPASRRYRPPLMIEDSSDLEIEIGQAIQRAVAPARTRPPRGPAPADSDAPPKQEEAPQPIVLLLGGGPDRGGAGESTLRIRGIRHHDFRDPARALEAFRSTTYALVLADAKLSRGDGLEFAARIRELPGVEHIPIVLIDDRENAETARAAEAAGIAAYLVRPLRWTDVADSLIDLLEHPSRRRWTRYPMRLSVQVTTREGVFQEMTQEVSRRGICLQTRREIYPGSVERYTVTPPRPLPRIEAVGSLAHRTTVPGRPHLLAGIDLLGFRDGDEAHWIHLVEALDRRADTRASRK